MEVEGPVNPGLGEGVVVSVVSKLYRYHLFMRRSLSGGDRSKSVDVSNLSSKSVGVKGPRLSKDWGTPAEAGYVV